MAERNLGRMGETEFEQWSAQVGLIANRAETDYGGWDYLVQLPTQPLLQGRVRSLDHLPAAPSLWIQVKARDRPTSSPRVKLSNLQRMIAPEWPAFFLVLTYENRARPVDAHLVPVDERLMGQILKRLREVPETEVNKLHRRMMTIACAAEHRLETLDGTALRRAVESHIGPDPVAYHARKKGWYEHAGFEGHRYEFTLRTLSDERHRADERLVDFALGLTDELPSELVRFEERRFNILKPVTLLRKVPSEVSVRIPTLPSEPAKVEIQNDARARRVSFQCRFYNPRTVFPFLPETSLRFRLAAELFEMIIDPSTNALEVSGQIPPLNTEWLLSQLAPALQLVEWLDRGDRDLRGTIMIRDSSVPFGGQLTANLSNLDAPRRAVVRAALDAETLVNVLAIPGDFKVTGRELLAQAARLADAALLVRTDAPLEVRGEVDAHAPEDVRIGYPLVTGAPIGRICVVAGFALYGVPIFEAAGEGRKRFILKPQRERVHLDTFAMKPGVKYKFDVHLEKVRRWLETRDISVLDLGHGEPGGALAIERIP